MVKTEPVTSGWRSNTVAPTNFFSLSSEQLMSMNDLELISFADQYLSIAIPLGTKRTTILTRIVNASVGVTS